MERDIEEDRRMAAFLQSRDYKDESWMTQEMLYYRWVEQGAPRQYYVPKVEGFRNEKEKEQRDSIPDEGMA